MGPSALEAACRGGNMATPAEDDKNILWKPNPDFKDDTLERLRMEHEAAMSAIVEREEAAECERERRGGDSEDDSSESEDLGPETAVDGGDADDAELDAEIERVQLRNRERASPDPIAHAARASPVPVPVRASDVDIVAVENVGESGDESEDEWNYFGGQQKQQQQQNADSASPALPPHAQPTHTQRGAWEEDEESSEMNSSPLNPDAPVFVPTGADSPLSPISPALTDRLLAESPRKPLPMDDAEPDLHVFATEAGERPASPADLINGHSVEKPLDLNGDNKLLEDMQRVQHDTTQFCNIQVGFAADVDPVSGDIDEELFERLKSKERDPMSMSFYREQDERCEPSADLNAVQPLPDSDDDDKENLPLHTDTPESHKLLFEQIPETPYGKLADDNPFNLEQGPAVHSTQQQDGVTDVDLLGLATDATTDITRGLADLRVDDTDNATQYCDIQVHVEPQHVSQEILKVNELADAGPILEMECEGTTRELEWSSAPVQHTPEIVTLSPEVPAGSPSPSASPAQSLSPVQTTSPVQTASPSPPLSPPPVQTTSPSPAQSPPPVQTTSPSLVPFAEREAPMALSPESDLQGQSEILAAFSPACESSAPFVYSPAPPAVSASPLAESTPPCSPVPSVPSPAPPALFEPIQQSEPVNLQARIPESISEPIQASIPKLIQVNEPEPTEASASSVPSSIDIVETEPIETEREVLNVEESRAQEICIPVTSELLLPAPATPAPLIEVQDTLIADSERAPAQPELSAGAPAVVAAAAATATIAAAKTKTPTSAKKPTPAKASLTPAKTASVKTSTKPTTPAIKKTPVSTATRTPTSTTKAISSSAASSASKQTASPAAIAGKTSVTKPIPSPALTATKISTTTKSTATTKSSPSAGKPSAPRPATARAAPLSARPAPAKPTTVPAPPATAKPTTAPAPRLPPARPSAARPASAPARPKPAPAKTTEAKPLTNGDIKPIRRPVPGAAPAPKPAPAKPAPAPAASKQAAPRPAPRAAPARPAPPRPTNTTTAAQNKAAPRPVSRAPASAARAPLDKQSKDLANKRLSNGATKTAPTRTTLPTKTGAKPVAKAAPPAVPNGSAEAARPHSPPDASDAALLPDLVA